MQSLIRAPRLPRRSVAAAAVGAIAALASLSGSAWAEEDGEGASPSEATEGSDSDSPSTIGDGDATIRDTVEGDSFTIEGSQTGGEAQSSRAEQVRTSNPGEPPAEPEYWAWEPRWGTSPETGEPCVAFDRRVDVDPNSQMGISWEIQAMQMFSDPRLDGVDERLCQPEILEELQSPAVRADRFVRNFPIPAPQLTIDPGHALTGLPTYVVIGGQDDFTVTDTLGAFGTITVDFRVTSVEVDWGNGDVSVYDDGRRGVPYDGPAGQQISTTYQFADPESVVGVTVRWAADWRVAGFSDTTGGMFTSSDIELPVYEYRAVRVRP